MAKLESLSGGGGVPAMASNEETIRDLYLVAEKEPKQFRSLFTQNGYWWNVPAGVKYHGDDIARAADIYSAAFPDAHSTSLRRR